MRKVLSFVLVLSLVLGSMGMAFAAPMSDVAGEDFEDAVNVLTELGVVAGYPDGTYRPDKVVTRGEMAKLIVAALGLEDYAAGASGFKDMAGHWSDKYVAFATSLGIINGYPDGTFRPDATVSYDEAAKMLVAALGYTEDALVGSWPANWVMRAKSLGILDGITGGSKGANRGDIATMLFQTLGLELGTVDKNGEWNANKPPETMLDRLGAKDYKPAGAEAKAGDAFVLTQAIADEAVANVKAHLGAYVTAYANSKNKIIAIKEVKSVFLTGDFTAVTADATTGAISAGTFEDGDEVEYTVRDEFDTVYLLNGADADVSDFTAPFADVVIAVDVSGKKIDAVYSVAGWTALPHFMFSKGDLDLEENTLDGIAFKLDDNDEIDLNFFALLGVSALEDIEKDNVVYVYEGDFEDDYISRVEVGTEVIKGTVSKINAAGNKITVKGDVYEQAKYTKNNVANVFADLDINDEVTLYLDYNGDVYHVKAEESTGGNYAVILQVEEKGGGIDAAKAKVKLFLADGTVEVFSVDGDLVSEDGLFNKGTWNDTTGAAFSVDVPTGDAIVVEYGLDKDGLVDFIEVVQLGALADKQELTAKAYYDKKPVDSDAVIFGYSGSDFSKKDNYSVTTVSKIKGTEFKARYYEEKNKILVMMIDGDAESTEGVYGVVTGFAKSSDSSTERQVTMLIDGASKTLEMKKTYYDSNVTALNATAAKVKLYEVTTGNNGEVTGLLAVTSGAAVDGDIEVLVEDETYNTDDYADGAIAGVYIDSDAVVYLFKADASAFVKSSVSASNLKDSEYSLFDLDGDGVADIVLIVKTALSL